MTAQTSGHACVKVPKDYVDGDEGNEHGTGRSSLLGIETEHSGRVRSNARGSGGCRGEVGKRWVRNAAGGVGGTESGCFVEAAHDRPRLRD